MTRTISASPILGLINAVYVINLPFRTDRRREVAAELERVGLSFEDQAVILFEAVRPDAAGDFPSIGARGCFMSHLGVLRTAIDTGAASVLILEDDADFTPDFVALSAAQITAIAEADWDILYLGYLLGDGGGDKRETLIRTIAPATPVRQTHAMIVRNGALKRVADYLETMAARPGGHPEGGPMHVDGAYSWFRRDNPDIKTAVASTPWAIQRASRTDIHGTGLKDRLPFIDFVRRVRNRFQRT